MTRPQSAICAVGAYKERGMGLRATICRRDATPAPPATASPASPALPSPALPSPALPILSERGGGCEQVERNAVPAARELHTKSPPHATLPHRLQHRAPGAAAAVNEDVIRPQVHARAELTKPERRHLAVRGCCICELRRHQGGRSSEARNGDPQ